MFHGARASAWRDWDEWKETYQMLYSRDVKEIMLGCARVSAWAVKQDLPTAVEVTASLQRELHTERKSVDALALAVIRFINGVVEPFKNANQSVSIATIGASYGVPEYIITIRHSATHGKMPSFALAAQGALSALEWLRVNYWEAQCATLVTLEKAVNENLMGFLLHGTPAFEGMRHNDVLSFGVLGLVKLTAFNESHANGRVSAAFQARVVELVADVGQRYRGFREAFALELAKATAHGRTLASEWLDCLAEKKAIPVQSVAAILRWADPAELGGALPMKLIKELAESDKVASVEAVQAAEKPQWPPTSLGSLPCSTPTLSMTDDEWSYTDPYPRVAMHGLVSATTPSTHRPKATAPTPRVEPDNLLEIW